MLKKLLIYLCFQLLFASCHTESGVKNFELTTGQNKVITLDNFKGKVLLLYFGFASCPDVCPMSLSKINSLVKKLKPNIKPLVQTLFVSVDYKRDTPEDTQEYAKYFNKDFLGATGTKEQIELATLKYGVNYKFVELKESEMEYTVDHTSYLYIIDKKGKLITQYSSDNLNTDTLKIIEQLAMEN